MAQQLRDEGFSEAYALQGGFDAWQAAGGPVEPKHKTTSASSQQRQPKEKKDAPNKKIAEETQRAQKELEEEITGAAQREVIAEQETG